MSVLTTLFIKLSMQLQDGDEMITVSQKKVYCRYPVEGGVWEANASIE